MVAIGGTKNRIELVTWIIIGAALLTVLPFARTPGPMATGVPAIFSGAITVADAATAFLLLSRAMEARTVGLLLLASTYLYSAIMTPLMLLVFPDAVVPGRSVLATAQNGNQAVSWIFQLWFWGFSITAFASVVATAWWPNWKIPRPLIGRATLILLAVTTSAALGLSFLVLATLDHLPLMMVGLQWTAFNSIATIGSYIFLLLAILVIQFRLRPHDELFRWLQVALIVFALANALTTISGARYTIGWTAGRIFWAASACVVLIYFLGQFWKQQRGLSEARENLEQRIVERTQEKDQLIRVINHRIGNQLQVIQSMLSIEGRKAKSEEAISIIDRLGAQINAMSREHVHYSQSDYLKYGEGEKDGTIIPR